jgi:hypothetical protein
MLKLTFRIVYVFVIAFNSLQESRYALLKQLNAIYKDHIKGNTYDPIFVF